MLSAFKKNTFIFRIQYLLYQYSQAKEEGQYSYHQPLIYVYESLGETEIRHNPVDTCYTKYSETT